MKKIIFLFLLLAYLGIATEVDAHRDVFYSINENMEVTTKYIDYIYGAPEATLAYIQQAFPSEADYIATRVAPGFVLQDFSIEKMDDYVKITMNGRYDLYVEKLAAGKIHIGGKGFVDRTCKDFPYEILTPIKQSFHIEVKIPESWKITELPPPMQSDNLITFQYVTDVKDSTLFEDVYFELKNTTTVTYYCEERDEINKALQVGFTAVQVSDEILPIFIIIILLIIIMIILTMRLNK